MVDATLEPNPGYAACLLGGAVLGLVLARRRLRGADGIAIVVLGGAAGLLGAALTGGDSPGTGLSLLGGLLAYGVASAALAAWARFPVPELLDIAVPSALLGLAVARLGCLFGGCCAGERDFPFPLLDSLALLLAGSAAGLARRPGAAAAGAGLYAVWRLSSTSLRATTFTSDVLAGLVLAGAVVVALHGRQRIALPLPAGFGWIRSLGPSLLTAAVLLPWPLSLACSHREFGPLADCSKEMCKGGWGGLFSRGGPSEASIALETRAGDRLAATLRAEGVVAWEALDDGPGVLLRGTLRSIVVEVDGLRIEGAGSLEATMDAEGRFVIRPLDLSDGLRAALKAVEPYSAGALTVKDGTAPDTRLDAALRRALSSGGPGLRTEGTATVAGLRRSFRVDTRADSAGLSAVFRLESEAGDLVVQADYRRLQAMDAASGR